MSILTFQNVKNISQLNTGINFLPIVLIKIQNTIYCASNDIYLRWKDQGWVMAADSLRLSNKNADGLAIKREFPLENVKERWVYRFNINWD